MPVGILGGTFDPVHFGHLRTALEILQDLALDEVRVVPSHTPPHRGPAAAAPAQRLRMLEAALDGVPGMRIDTRELDRAGTSYSVDTLLSLRAELMDEGLCLILGTDAFSGFPAWHRWREIPELCHIVVAQRPGWRAPERGEVAELLRARETIDPADLVQGGGRILRRSVTQLDISASRIRADLQAGRSARFLVPEGVRRLIERERIYS